MSRPDPRSRAPVAEDALLSGLTRLKTADSSTGASASAPRAASARAPRVRSAAVSAAAFNIPYAYFPTPASGRRPDPLLPVSRADILEAVERATGLHRAGGADLSAAEKLLRWIRAGSAEVPDVFNGIVAGSARKDASLNARVLSVVAWLCYNGGPLVLYPAVYVVSARRPSPALRVCVDVLRSLGYETDPESVLHDDNRVRELARAREMGSVSAVTGKGKRAGPSREVLLEGGVEAYAIAMGRKMVFHRRFPEVEVNYSLDRHYRKLHIEDKFDKTQKEANMERLPLLISNACLMDIALITKSAVAAVDWLEQAGAPLDIVVIALADACNAYSFSEYLRVKIGAEPVDVCDLEEERYCLAQKLLAFEHRGGSAWRLVKRYVEANVVRAITDSRINPYRPESKHRREVLCTFTSFHAMHTALGPSSQSHRDIAD